jgi:hypothetical protein
MPGRRLDVLTLTEAEASELRTDGVAAEDGAGTCATCADCVGVR